MLLIGMDSKCQTLYDKVNKQSNATQQGEAKITIDRNLVVLEEGTGTWCEYCPGAAMGIDDLLDEGYNIAAIAYHYSDDYATDETEDRVEFYGMYGLPTVQFDGSYDTVVGGNDTASMIDTYIPIVEDRLMIGSDVKIDFDGIQIIDSIALADVKVTKESSIASTNLFLVASLTESHIPEIWPQSGIMSEVNFVCRDMYPDPYGTQVDLVNNDEVEVTVKFTMDESWVPENCELVFFIQDTATREILNGIKVSGVFPVSISDKNPKSQIKIFPNPVENILTVSGIGGYRNLIIYNILGKEVLNNEVRNEQETFDVSFLNAGLYVINLYSRNKKINTLKFVKH